MRTDLRFPGWIVVIGVVAVFVSASAAQGDDSAARARAMIAKWAGSYRTEGFLKEPAVHAELQALLGSEINHLMDNLNVRGGVDLSGETLSVNGNAPHQGTEEEAIVCVTVLPLKTIVEAAILSKGTIAVYSREKQYENA
ncbi:MAG TPA: hypothetical protein VIV15_04715, partial [Anaerolineales bacterium]